MIGILFGLTAIWAYVVYWGGGITGVDWPIVILILGMLALYCWIWPRDPHRSRRLTFWLWGPAILLPSYVALQLVPLPIVLVNLLSPSRAELVRAATPILGANSFATISAVPAATAEQLGRIIAYVLFFLLISEIGSRMPPQSWTVAWPIIVVATLESIAGIAMYVSGPTAEFARGTFINRNHFGGMLAMALPFPLLSIWRAWNKRHWMVVGLSAASFAIIFLGILRSLSRMTFVATACSFAVILFLLLRARTERSGKRMVVTTVIVIAILIAMSGAGGRLLSRFEQTATGTDMNGLIRLQVWKDTLRLIAHYPLTGCGAGAFESAFPRYESTPVFYNVDFAHDDYLQGIAELGILGFAIVAILASRILRTAFQTASRKTSGNHLLAIACCGSLTSILVHSLADFNLYVPSNALLLCWIAGIASSLPERTE